MIQDIKTMHFWIGMDIRKHFVWSLNAEPWTCLVWKDEFHVALELKSLLLDFIVLNMVVCETRKIVLIKKIQIYKWTEKRKINLNAEMFCYIQYNNFINPLQRTVSLHKVFDMPLKGVTYSATKILNHVPSNILELQENKALFKSALRKYLLTHILYTVEEFLLHNNDTN
jgi:hypothetical protein